MFIELHAWMRGLIILHLTMANAGMLGPVLK